MSYLPLTDDGLRAWALNFATRLGNTADPSTVGLTVADVDAYGTLMQDYTAKLTAAIDPATRGSATVFAKDDTKKDLIADSRRLAMIVTNHPGVTDQQRHDFGLTVKDETPTPVPVPSSSPTIDIVSVNGLTINIRLHNGESTSRAKPVGVKGASVFTYVGETPPSDMDAWTFRGMTSRTITHIDMPGTTAPGSLVWITAVGFNTKSQSRPATTPISTHLQGGGLSPAA